MQTDIPLWLQQDLTWKIKHIFMLESKKWKDTVTALPLKFDRK